LLNKYRRHSELQKKTSLNIYVQFLLTYKIFTEMNAKQRKKEIINRIHSAM
jgi:hypothetical protein